MTRRQRTSELMWPRLFRRFDGGSRTLQGQLRDMLVHAMVEGYLSPGEALPSSRLLAQLLGLSRSTVTLALQALVDKGLIVSHARSALVVSDQLQATYLGARQRAATPAPGVGARRASASEGSARGPGERRRRRAWGACCFAAWYCRISGVDASPATY